MDQPEQVLQNIVEPNPPLPDYSLDALPETLKNTVLAQGWNDLMLVQKKTIPYILNAKNLIVQSKTGSGKTAAFVLPILQVIEKTVATPQVMVLVPTRELAKQVEKEFSLFANPMGIRCAAVYGGVSYNGQIQEFEKGCQVVVGTPGRVLDHLIRGTLNLNNLRDLVLDEADEMLSMGFYPDMKRILRFLPSERCSYMFSATMPANVKRLSHEFLGRPLFLNLCPSNSAVASMDRLYYKVDSMEKDKALLQILETENPESGLIFCNTKKEVQYVYDFLLGRGFSAGILSGDISQNIREKMLANLKERKIRFLVATDVAARGIDVKSLSHVFLYDHPDDPESYIHRSGRTARAGSSGLAISIVNDLQEMQLQNIAKQYGLQFQKKELKNDEELAELRRERAVVQLEQESRQLKQFDENGMEKMLALTEEFAQSPEGKKMLSLLLFRHYWENFIQSAS